LTGGGPIRYYRGLYTQEVDPMPLIRAFARHHRQVAVVASLMLSTAVFVALLALRLTRTDALDHLHLLWNLFLAWLPFLSALAAYNLYKRQSRLNWLVIAACAAAWLLFFPNAPYVVTDLGHLYPREGVPFWYDLLLVATFVWTGLFLGLVSLYLMQTLVRNTAGPAAGWAFALGVVGLSSFGVYLGRFRRWNSWDVLFSPWELLADIWVRVRHPIAHYQAFVFSLLFAAFFVSAYLMLIAFTHLSREPQRMERIEEKR
jgi:uncharacterized membrane protein